MKISKAAAVILAMVMAAGFASCQKTESGSFPENGSAVSEGKDVSKSKDENRKSGEIASKEHIFSAESINISGGTQSVSGVFCKGEKIYTAVGGKILTYSPDGTLESTMDIFPTEEQRFLEFAAAWGDGFLTVENSEGFSCMVKYDNEGNKLSETSLENIVNETGERIYITSAAVSDDGTLFLTQYGGLYFVNDKLSGKISGGADRYFEKVIRTGGGRIFAEYSDPSGNRTLAEVGDSGLLTEFPVDFTGNLLSGFGEYDMFVLGSTKIFAYDIETGETSTFIDLSASGIDAESVSAEKGIAVLPDGRVILTVKNLLDGGFYSELNLSIYILSVISPDEIPDRNVIKIYALAVNSDVKRAITDFNKNSGEYYIELTDFYDVGGDYADKLSRMNSEMTAGNIPDIIAVSGAMPVESYASKGLLANLYDFMENDPDFRREDYLQNIFTAYETDGKLYEAVPGFSIQTLAGKTSKVGDTQGWTMDEFIDFADRNASDGSWQGLFESTSCSEMNMLLTFMSFNFGSYMNEKAGECYFDGDDFIKLLEFCNRFPEKTVSKDKIDFSAEQDAYREDRTLLMTATVGNFRDIRTLEQVNFGERVTFKGYPCGGNGSFISEDFSLAITSKAADPDGAWEFVKYFWSDEYQSKYIGAQSYDFPVKISALERAAANAKTNSGRENVFPAADPNTDEDNARMMEFINSLTEVRAYNSYIYDIVREEAGAYFSGQKTAEDVSEIIQNRAANYIAENR